MTADDNSTAEHKGVTVYLDVHGSTLMSDADMAAFARKIGDRLGRIIPKRDDDDGSSGALVPA